MFQNDPLRPGNVDPFAYDQRGTGMFKPSDEGLNYQKDRTEQIIKSSSIQAALDLGTLLEKVRHVGQKFIGNADALYLAGRHYYEFVLIRVIRVLLLVMVLAGVASLVMPVMLGVGLAVMALMAFALDSKVYVFTNWRDLHGTLREEIRALVFGKDQSFLYLTVLVAGAGLIGYFYLFVDLAPIVPVFPQEKLSIFKKAKFAYHFYRDLAIENLSTYLTVYVSAAVFAGFLFMRKIQEKVFKLKSVKPVVDAKAEIKTVDPDNEAEETQPYVRGVS